MDIAPTGREVAITLFITYRIANGKIVEHWMLADMLSLLQQVGALPAPA
jgi:predicted ester cyclase